MKERIRPLTDKMIRQLKEARESQLSAEENQVITPGHFKGTLAGLYKRGIVKTRKAVQDGKYVESVYITLTGLRFLEEHEEKLAKKDDFNEKNGM